MPTYKDISLLTQKATIAGTEKLPVSDTEYITPSQIVGTVDNVPSATKLQTARTIWGQSFDGTGNVDGNLESTGHGKFAGIYIGATYDGGSQGFDCIERVGYGSMLYMQYYTIGGINMCQGGGNVGIGDAAPSEKLVVNGNAKATSFIKSGGTSSQFLKADGSVDSNTYATTTDLSNAIGDIETLLAAI